MTVPIVLLVKNKKKTWCQGYCPRASLYTSCGKVTSKFSLKTPQFFIKGKMKWIMLAYFGFSMTMMIFSTLQIALGYITPDYVIKFLMYIPLIRDMPQLFEFEFIAPWITYLSHSFYSMMLTTTVLGLILAFFINQEHGARFVQYQPYPVFILTA